MPLELQEKLLALDGRHVYVSNSVFTVEGSLQIDGHYYVETFGGGGKAEFQLSNVIDVHGREVILHG